MNVVAHNMLASNAARQYNINVKGKRKNTEKLSSGYKINRAADDAAGLSISEKMRNQIRNLNQSMKNIEDGISLMNVADGALNESHKILHRIEELAVQAANDTNAQDDRDAIDDEVQELKGELDRIFRTTHFNGKKLWTTSYNPSVTGIPNDIQMYHDTTHPSGYGGVLINEKRFTWEEMGVKFNEDGTFVPKEYSITDKDNPDEDITFIMRSGKRPPDFARKYQWHTDGENIFINGVKATTCTELGMEFKQDTDRNYSFDFHGTTIEFQVPAGDRKEEFIDGINGGNFATQVTWESQVDGARRPETVDIRGYSTYLTIEDTWKDRIDTGNSDFFMLEADETGITLKDITDHVYSSKTWEEFGIYDWGEQTDTGDGTPVNPNKTYSFYDSTTGFSFEFKLADISAKGDVNAELTTGITASYSSTVATYVSLPRWSSSLGVEPSVQVGNTSMPFDMQLDSGKSFTNWDNGSFPHSFSADWYYHDDPWTSVDYYGIRYSYSIEDTSGNTLANAEGKWPLDGIVGTDSAIDSYINYISTKKDKYSYNQSSGDFLSAILYGASVKLKLESDNGFNTELNISVNGINKSRPNWSQIYDEEYNTRYRNAYQASLANWLAEDPDNRNANDFQYTPSDQEKALWNGIASNRFQLELKYYKNDLKTYAAQVKDYLYGISLSTKLTSQPQICNSWYDPGYTSEDPFGGILVHPPIKEVYIQSGANRGEDHRLEWNSLTMSSLGLGGVSVDTREGAEASINAVQRAVKVLSAERSNFGAQTNRLTATLNGNELYAENLQKAESQIRDTDYAEEIGEFHKHNILEQAGQAMIAQANQSQQGLLQLLQS